MTNLQIKKIRLKNDKSQKEFSDLLWISERHLRRYESELTRVPLKVKKRIEELKLKGELK
jgi:DNA-binding transcriptional regulator YiaG